MIDIYYYIYIPKDYKSTDEQHNMLFKKESLIIWHSGRFHTIIQKNQQNNNK